MASGGREAGMDRPSPSRTAGGRDAESERPGMTAQTSSGAMEPLHRLRQDFGRMLDQYFRGWPSPSGLWEAATQGWGLDVREDDGKMTVRAEAPGFEPSDFDIDVQGNQLILRAVHRDESSEKETGSRQWRRQEYYRSVPLTGAIDADRIEASYRHGILTVTLPKSEQSRRRRIEVTT